MRRCTSPADLLHIFSAPSLGTWMPAFATPGSSRFATIPCRATIGETVSYIESLAAHRKEHIVIHADHNSLMRDAYVGRRLEGSGFIVTAPSIISAISGQDKLMMRRLLRHSGVRQPADMMQVPKGSGQYIIKKRNGTEGIGTRLGTTGELKKNELIEPFISGEEYSVNVFVNGGDVVTFPPVGKGSTRLDLVPPAKRTRQCPVRTLGPLLEADLRRWATIAVMACGAVGFAEAEFVIDAATNEVLLFEVNPRVSGTLRLSAMATATPILDLYFSSSSAHLSAVNTALEAPYSGDPVCDLAGGVVATSRVTVSASDEVTARTRLDQILGRGSSDGAVGQLRTLDTRSPGDAHHDS